jgi:hypothetical protein
MWAEQPQAYNSIYWNFPENAHCVVAKVSLIGRVMGLTGWVEKI